MSIELRRVRVCAVGEIPPGEGRVVRIGDKPVAVFRSGDAFHALDNTCTHMGGPLADGLVADDTVACPLHERRFALASGTAVGHDCGAVAAYPVELEHGDVFLTVPVLRGPDGAAVTTGTFTDSDVRRWSQDGEPPAPADSHDDVRAQADAIGERHTWVSDNEGDVEVERAVKENADLVPDGAHRE